MGKTWKDKNKWSKKQHDSVEHKTKKDTDETAYSYNRPKIRKFEWYWSDNE